MKAWPAIKPSCSAWRPSIRPVLRIRRRSARSYSSAVSKRTKRRQSSRNGRCRSTRWAGIYSDFPQLVELLNFTEVKDYDDWIVRLRAIPHAFDQVTTNMSIGMDDHRVPPKLLLEKALEQVKQLANQKPEDSPLAMPLKKFPASIPASEQERIKVGNALGHRQAGAAGLPAFRPFHGGELHPGGVAPSPESPLCRTAQNTTSSSSVAPRQLT